MQERLPPIIMKNTSIFVGVILLLALGVGFLKFNSPNSNVHVKDSSGQKTKIQNQKQNPNQEVGNSQKTTSNSNQNEFIVYQDGDIVFKYPKKLVSSKPQDNFAVKEGEKWKVVRKGNTIHILAPFENKNEIGDNTFFTIKIFSNVWSVQKEFNKIVPLYKESHNVPVPQWGNKLYSITPAGYYVGVLPKVGIDMGILDDVYFLVPGGLDGRAQSQKPNEKHFVVYARSDIYADYVKKVLIPSIKINVNF